MEGGWRLVRGNAVQRRELETFHGARRAFEERVAAPNLSFNGFKKVGKTYKISLSICLEWQLQGLACSLTWGEPGAGTGRACCPPGWSWPPGST